MKLILMVEKQIKQYFNCVGHVIKGASLKLKSSFDPNPNSS